MKKLRIQAESCDVIDQEMLGRALAERLAARETTVDTTVTLCLVLDECATEKCTTEKRLAVVITTYRYRGACRKGDSFIFAAAPPLATRCYSTVRVTCTPAGAKTRGGARRLHQLFYVCQCGKQATRLFLPPGRTNWGCQDCLQLSYRSERERRLGEGQLHAMLELARRRRKRKKKPEPKEDP